MNAPVQTATVTALREANQAREASLPAVQMGFGSLQSFELMQRGAKLLASSTLVPQAYQGNLANCVIALNMAQRIGADPLMVMQNLYVVHGSPSWSAKFLIASVNVCGRFTALRYEWRGTNGGNDQACRAWAIEKATGERLDGAWITWTMVEKEGWSKKNGSKWLSMRDQMFIYRAAAFWQRAYAPELTMGLSTAEEMEDVIDVHPDGSYTVTAESLRAAETQVAEVVQESIDESTGEIQPAPTFDHHAFVEKIKACKDVDVLDLLGDTIRDEIQGEANQAVAREAYNKRRDELTGA